MTSHDQHRAEHQQGHRRPPPSVARHPAALPRHARDRPHLAPQRRRRADPDALAEAAYAEQAAATARIDARTAAAADGARQRIDDVAVPDFFASHAIYLDVARDRMQAALRSPTARATLALIARLPEDRARRMVERLAIRAYAQDDQTAARFLAAVRRDNPPPPKGEADPDAEYRVEEALQRLALDCQAILADLGDVHRWSAQRPGTELATVTVDRLRRTDYDDDTEMVMVDLGAPLDGAR